MDHERPASGGYGKFFAMIGVAMVAMYALTYANSYQVLDHMWFSETRLFMTLLMGGSMAIIMLGFMPRWGWSAARSPWTMWTSWRV